MLQKKMREDSKEDKGEENNRESLRGDDKDKNIDQSHSFLMNYRNMKADEIPKDTIIEVMDEEEEEKMEECGGMDERINKDNEEIKQLLKNQLSEAKSRTDQLEKELKEKDSKLEETIKNLMECRILMTKHELEMDKMKREMEAVEKQRKECEEMKSKFAEYQKENEEIKTQLSQRTKEVDQFKLMEKNLKEDLQRLDDKYLHDTKQYKSTLQNHIDKITELQDKLEQVNGHYENLKQKFRETLSEKNKNEEEWKRKEETLNRDVTDLSKEIDSLVCSLETISNDNTLMKDELNKRNKRDRTEEEEKNKKISQKESKYKVINKDSVVEAGKHWKLVLHVPQKFKDFLKCKVTCYNSKGDKVLPHKDFSGEINLRFVNKEDWKNLFETSFEICSTKIRKINVSIKGKKKNSFEDSFLVFVQPSSYDHCVIEMSDWFKAGDAIKGKARFLDKFDNNVKSYKNKLTLNAEEKTTDVKTDDKNRFIVNVNKSGTYSITGSKRTEGGVFEIVPDVLRFEKSKYQITPDKKQYMGGESFQIHVDPFDRFGNKASLEGLNIIFDEKYHEIEGENGVVEIQLPKNINGRQKIDAKFNNQKYCIFEIDTYPASPSHSTSSVALKTEKHLKVGSLNTLQINLKDSEGRVWDPISSAQLSVETLFDRNVKILTKGCSGRAQKTVRRLKEGVWQVDLVENSSGNLYIAVTIENVEVFSTVVELSPLEPSFHDSRVVLVDEANARVNQLQTFRVELYDRFRNATTCAKEEIEFNISNCKEPSFHANGNSVQEGKFTPLNEEITYSLKHVSWNKEKSSVWRVKEERKLRIYLENEKVMRNVFLLMVEYRHFLPSQFIITNNCENADVILILSVNRNKSHWNEIGECVDLYKNKTNAQIFILKGMQLEKYKDNENLKKTFLSREIPETTLLKEKQQNFEGFVDVIWFDVDKNDLIFTEHRDNELELERLSEMLVKVPEVERREEYDEISYEKFNSMNPTTLLRPKKQEVVNNNNNNNNGNGNSNNNEVKVTRPVEEKERIQVRNPYARNNQNNKNTFPSDDTEQNIVNKRQKIENTNNKEQHITNTTTTTRAKRNPYARPEKKPVQIAPPKQEEKERSDVLNDMLKDFEN